MTSGEFKPRPRFGAQKTSHRIEEERVEQNKGIFYVFDNLVVSLTLTVNDLCHGNLSNAKEDAIVRKRMWGRDQFIYNVSAETRSTTHIVWSTVAIDE